jgi:hypothetical protein
MIDMQLYRLKVELDEFPPAPDTEASASDKYTIETRGHM